MTPERWIKIREVFDAALARAPSERAAFLASACHADATLFDHVESLLAAYEGASDFLEKPAFGACEPASGAELRPFGSALETGWAARDATDVESDLRTALASDATGGPLRPRSFGFSLAIP